MRLAYDRDKMVLAVGVKQNVLLYKHLVVLIFVFKELDIWKVRRIEARENFLNIHFSHTLWCSAQAVVGAI